MLDAVLKQPSTSPTDVANQNPSSINGNRIADKVCDMLRTSWAKKADVETQSWSSDLQIHRPFGVCVLFAQI